MILHLLLEKEGINEFPKKFIFIVGVSNILGRTVDVQKTADFCMLIHSDMRFVIENWFFEIST